MMELRIKNISKTYGKSKKATEKYGTSGIGNCRTGGVQRSSLFQFCI